MADWIDTSQTRDKIQGLLTSKKSEIAHFGSTINQVFEAFVFCATVTWYGTNKWQVHIHNPDDPKTKKPSKLVKFKFNTRGKPSGYSYASCEKDGNNRLEIRHQLRVATNHDKGKYPPANICLDVAVIYAEDGELGWFKSDTALPNNQLVTFGEAKHMAAYAELIASFIGIVHELQPSRLRRVRRGKWNQEHPAPFLYVSGTLYTTARGIVATVHNRRYDIDVYSQTTDLANGFSLPTKPAPKKAKKAKKAHS